MPKQLSSPPSDIIFLGSMKSSQLITPRAHGSSSSSSYAQVISPTAEQEESNSDAVTDQIIRTMDESRIQKPLPGQWRDGICSWANNLWPSCICSFCVCCGGWIAGQIAQASGYQAFQSFVAPYMAAFIVFLFIFLVTQNVVCLIVIWFIVFIYGIFLRLHFVKKHELNENSFTREILLAMCCCPCSLAQMARHSFGYRLVFDGDSKPEPPNYYPVVEDELEAQVRELELTEHETHVLGCASHEV